MTPNLLARPAREKDRPDELAALARDFEAQQQLLLHSVDEDEDEDLLAVSAGPIYALISRMLKLTLVTLMDVPR